MILWFYTLIGLHTCLYKLDVSSEFHIELNICEINKKLAIIFFLTKIKKKLVLCLLIYLEKGLLSHSCTMVLGNLCEKTNCTY